jgi:uncharacterized OB-fold protein
MTELRIERDEASAPFFDAALAGDLLIRRCPVCGRLYPPQQRRCADSDELEWAPTTGAATLVTWAVDHAPPVSSELASAGGDGSVIGVVELAEGPWMNAALPGVDPADLREEMALQVQFLRLGGGEPVPVFMPRAEPPSTV